MSLLLPYRMRRYLAVILALLFTAGWLFINPRSYESEEVRSETESETRNQSERKPSKNLENGQTERLALKVLERLETKGRAPKTNYKREQFYQNWPTVEGCSLRQRIIAREFGETKKLAEDGCKVISGKFREPYTGKELNFATSQEIAQDIQVDHVVALSDAWQKGAQNQTKKQRFQIATDPLNLLAVEAKANLEKLDSDAASWLPPNKAFRCQYVARQIAVKFKYQLWITMAEREAMRGVLEKCPQEMLP